MDAEKDKWECCDSCHEYNPDVEYRLDQYAYEICNEERWIYLCDDCHSERVADI